MGKQSIHFVTRGRSGRGGHVVLTQLFRELRRREYDVSLTSWHEAGTPLFPNCEALWSGLEHEIIEIPRGASPDECFAIEQAAIVEHLKNIGTQYDVVVLDGWPIAMAAVTAGIQRRSNVIQLVQADPVFLTEDVGKFWKSLAFRLVASVSMRRVAVSNNMASLAEGYSGEPVAHLPIFINDSYHRETFLVNDHSQLRLVSSAADFSVPEKGLDLLLSSIGQVGGVPLELTLIAGRGIERDFSIYPFSVKTTFCATPEEMVQELLKHDVYVNTSTKEAFGLAQAEAVALGMPVIALDAVGNRDFLNGENALFVTDKTKLPEAILSMCDIETRRQYASRAKQSMSSYRLTQTVDKLEEILFG